MSFIGCRNAQLNVNSLLLRMEEVKKAKFTAHCKSKCLSIYSIDCCMQPAEPVKLKVIKSNGGEKDSDHKPQNLLTNDIAATSSGKFPKGFRIY